MSKPATRVLIIDDAEDTREMYETALQHEGFHVILAEDGAAGLALAQQSQPDIIVLDLTMPRMDGFEVTRRLRADDRTRAIPIISSAGRRTRRMPSRRGRPPIV